MIAPKKASNGEVRLSVIIATYNNIQILKQCLKSWRQFAAHQPIELFVIADGCNDGTEEFLTEQAETEWGKKILRWFVETNVHELRCTNRGMREAAGQYLLSWHDDMFVKSVHLVPELLRTLDRYDDIGLISLSRGLLLHSAPRPQQWEELIDWNRVESTIGKRFQNWFYLCEVDAVMRPWIVRRNCIDTVGSLDEEFQLSEWDEADLCLRIRDAGWRVATHGYERLGYYEHLGSSTIGRTMSDEYKGQVLANGQLFHDRWSHMVQQECNRHRHAWRRRTSLTAWMSTLRQLIRYMHHTQTSIYTKACLVQGFKKRYVSERF